MPKSVFLYLERLLFSISVILLITSNYYKATIGTGLGALIFNSLRREQVLNESKTLAGKAQQQFTLLQENPSQFLPPSNPLSHPDLQHTLEEVDSKIEENYAVLKDQLIQVQDNEAVLTYLLPEIRRFHQDLPVDEYELVMGAHQSRDVFLNAIEACQTRLIIVVPWPKNSVFTQHISVLIQNKLKDGVEIHVGWGWWKDLRSPMYGADQSPYLRKQPTDSRLFSQNNPQGYTSLNWLKSLTKDPVNPLHLKLLGTHAKYVVQDDEVALLGSHNFGDLSHGQDLDREMGIRVTHKPLIQELVQQFMQATNYDLEAQHYG